MFTNLNNRTRLVLDMPLSVFLRERKHFPKSNIERLITNSKYVIKHITNILRTLPYFRNKHFYNLYQMSSYPLIINNPIHNGLYHPDSDTSDDLKETHKPIVEIPTTNYHVVFVSSTAVVPISYSHQYKMIQHHIRNIQVLNEHQMQYVKSLPPDLKDELLEVYNQCIQLFNDVMKNE